MIVDLNPAKWFAKKKTETVVIPQAVEQQLVALRTISGPAVTVNVNAADLYNEDGYLNHAVAKQFFQKVWPAKAEEKTMANEFVTILGKVGSIFEKGLSEAVKFLPLASTLAGFIFPPAVAPLSAATTVADLLQNAVAEAEQKLAAQGNQTGTGAQKLATVLTIVTSSVTGLLADPTVAAELKKAGITVNTAYITNLVNAVVSFLNVQGVVTTAAAA